MAELLHGTVWGTIRTKSWNEFGTGIRLLGVHLLPLGTESEWNERISSPSLPNMFLAFFSAISAPFGLKLVDSSSMVVADSIMPHGCHFYHS